MLEEHSRAGFGSFLKNTEVKNHGVREIITLQSEFDRKIGLDVTISVTITLLVIPPAPKDIIPHGSLATTITIAVVVAASKHTYTLLGRCAPSPQFSPPNPLSTAFVH